MLLGFSEAIAVCSKPIEEIVVKEEKQKMKRLRIIILLLLGMMAGAGLKAATNFQDESLNYVVSYKWGLIHKDAGEATLSLKNQGSNYVVTLTGKTKPWADKFYQVRDTLKGTIRKAGLRPLSYTRIAHEEGTYGHDEIKYSYNGDIVSGKATSTWINKKGNRKDKEKEFTASGPTYDMLSVFYFLRTINYSELTSGKTIEATLFSGSKVEKLTIRCVGEEKLKLRNKSEREAYHIKFNFTTEGKKKSSDDLDAWISTDPTHIPLQIVGSLPIGQVRCYYIP